MTKKPSQPDSKRAGGKEEESAVQPESMARFRKLAKKVVNVTREEVEKQERRERRSKS